MRTYHCGWCGWNGTGIEQQVAQVRVDVIPPVTRYVCYRCGHEVTPGPHSDKRGAGQ